MILLAWTFFQRKWIISTVYLKLSMSRRQDGWQAPSVFMFLTLFRDTVYNGQLQLACTPSTYQKLFSKYRQLQDIYQISSHGRFTRYCSLLRQILSSLIPVLNQRSKIRKQPTSHPPHYWVYTTPCSNGKLNNSQLTTKHRQWWLQSSSISIVSSLCAAASHVLKSSLH